MWIQALTARSRFELMGESTKFFLGKRVAAIPRRLAAARCQSAKIGGVHLSTPGQCATRISVPGCEQGIAAINSVVNDEPSDGRNHTLRLKFAHPLPQNGPIHARCKSSG